MDFEMMCETIARRLFQCGRFDDPLGSLANTDWWSGLHDEGFSKEHMCQVWAIIRRLQNGYLDGKDGRDELFEKSKNLRERTMCAENNKELFDIMIEIWDILEELGIEEHDHLNYEPTND